MKKNHYIYILSLFFAFTACNKEPMTSDNTSDNPSPQKTGSTPEVFIDEIIGDFANSKYLKNYSSTDFVTGISSIKDDPLSTPFIHSFNKRNESCTSASMLPIDIMPMNVSVESINIPSITNPLSRSSKSEKDSISSLFGKMNTFQIKRELTSRSGENDITASSDISLYIPKAIEITSPSIKSEKDLYPFCYSKNFVLRWNADPNNQNGVIIIFEWLGTTFGQGDYDAYVRRIDLVEDTGEILLNENLFKDIPNTALGYITLLRGNIEDVNVDNCTYKISGATQINMPFVLVTKIKPKSI